MKVAFFLANLGSGGTERVTCTIANYLSDKGHDVVIFTLLKTKCVYPLNDSIRMIPLSNQPGSDRSKLRGIINHVKRYFRFIDFVKAEKPDVLVSMLNLPIYISLLAKRKLKIPVLISERGDPNTLYSNHGIHHFMVNWLYPKADKLVFQTKNASDYFNKIPDRKKVVIPNPLNPKFINHPVPEKRSKDIAAVGRLNSAKNYPLLIEAFAKIDPEIRSMLKIYGEGELKTDMEALTERMGLSESVSFEGFCEDVEERIFDVGCYVLSSDHEGMPNALLEAMALGIPCVSTDCPCGAPRQLINNMENGILVPVGNTDALTNAISLILSDDVLAARLGKNARDTMSAYLPEVINPLWEAEITKLANIH